MKKVDKDHRFNVVMEEVIVPTIHCILFQMDEVESITTEVWDVDECTTDHGNEYYILVHLDIKARDEDDWLDLTTVAEALNDISNQYWEGLDEGDYHIEVKETMVMNNSIVLPIVMLK